MNQTGSTFDALNRLVQVTDALSNTAGYTYDVAGNRETATDQRGLVTSYVYDGFGEVIQQSSPDTGVTVFEYDSAGRRTRRTDARGVVTNWTYDDLGRVETMTFPASPAENVTYTYDDPTAGWYGIGRLASVTDNSGSTAYRYDARGNIVRVESVIGAQTYVMQYSYDIADRLVQMVYPSGLVDYARDSIGRVSSVTGNILGGAITRTLVSGLTWEAFGPLDGMTYDNGVTLHHGFDLDGRVAALDMFNGATPVLNLDYTFDLAGNITHVDDAGGGSRGRDYTYDNLYRLTQGKELAPGGSPVTLQTDYTYDGVGNRLTRTVGGALETYIYDAFSNRLDTVAAGGVTRTLGYTDSGNTATDDNGAGTVLTDIYDSMDRLTEVQQGGGAVATYVHNAMGQRVAKTVSGTTTHYIYDLSGNLVVEANGGTGTVKAEYVWLGRMPILLYKNITRYFIHPDALGTPQVVTNPSAAPVWDANYRPFGEATVTGTQTFNLRFPGQYADAETGLHYNGFRDYDASLGRYIQSDPIGLYGGWNTYAYVGGNPVTKLDFGGLLEVYVWDSRTNWYGSKTRWGHASMKLDDGTYISWWPGAINDNGWITWKQFYCADALPNRTFSQDVFDEGESPDHKIKIEGLDERAIKEWWETFKKDGNWCTGNRNCSSTVAHGLWAGGGWWAAPWSGTAVGWWTPDDVLDFAEALQ